MNKSALILDVRTERFDPFSKMSMKLALLVAVYLIVRVESSQEVMKNLAIQFAKPMEICRNEMGLSDAVLKEFYNFWREGHVFTDRQTGCAILCLASKLELLDTDMNLHHGNAQEFAKKHGADEGMAKQLVDLIHNCAQTVPVIADDPCQTTLNVAICFKAEIHKLNWAPSVDLIMAEILAET